MRKILLFLMIACKPDTSFESERVQQTAVILVHGGIEEVFPLFGPVREKEWAHGWDPEIIHPRDVLVAEHMVFRTKGHDEPYLWSVTKFDTTNHLVEYTVTAEERIWFITVDCREDGDQTRASVTYAFTGLSREGNARNKAALARMFAHGLKDWEEAINHYLSTGQQLIPDHN